MTRRNWIKIYPEGFLRRTLYYEIPDPGERWAWIGFLCLAGDNALDGQISVTDGMGYTDEQLAKLLDIGVEVLVSAKEKMIKYKKISVDDNNVIQILSWKTYQSEYQRQRDYRVEYKKLQRKVTTESDRVKLPIDRDIDKDIEEDIDKERNKKKESLSSKPKKVFDINSIEYKCSKYLFKKIRKNKPDYKKPNFQIWAKNIDLMLRTDNRNIKEIKKVIDWCQQDSFWYKTILSTSKLRIQYDQLVMKMNDEKPKQEMDKYETI